MPTFKNTDTTFHAFASRNHSEGKCGNVSFDSDTIYSYGNHFPIATFHGDSFVLITNRTHSVTTAGHISATKRALNHVPSCIVDNVNPTTTREHRANVVDMLQRARSLANDWTRSRKYKDMIQSDIVGLMNSVKRYLAHFKLKPLKTTAKALEAFAPIGFAYPQNVIDGENQKPSEQKQAAVVAFIGYLLDWSEAESIKQAAKRKRDAAKLERERAAEAEAAEARRVESEARALERVAEWRTGATVAARLMDAAPVALRLSVGGFEVETSHGAAVSVSDFKRAWKALNSGKLQPGTTIGDFTFNRIDGIGDKRIIVVGCHRIPINEIRALIDFVTRDKRPCDCGGSISHDVCNTCGKIDD